MQNPNLEDLESRLLDIAGHLNATEYQLITLLSEFDEHDGWHGDGIRSFSHWLNWKLGLGPMIAREKVRVARAIRVLPAITEAFSRGIISYSKVRAMTRVATPANETLLLQIAEYGTAAQLERLCRQYRKIQIQDEETELSAWKPERSCTWFLSDDDTMEFRVRLPADEAEVVIAAIERVADLIFQERCNETLTDDSNGTNVSAGTPSPNLPDIEERRADALACLAEQSLKREIESNAPIRDVVVHLNANPTHPEYQIAGRPFAYDHHGNAVGDDVLRRLTCDCRTTPVLQDNTGNVLDIGRKSRVVPTAMRLALSIRDRCCRFPGCTQHRWTDAHHVKHWVDGGETKLDNLITLCRSHHRMLHKGEFSIEASANDFQFFDTDQKRIDQSDSNRQMTQAVQITSEPNSAKWGGEALDMDLTLQGLESADQRGGYPASESQST